MVGEKWVAEEKRPASVVALKSRILSPIATPGRGEGSELVLNTPYGRFWIGKWESGSISKKHLGSMMDS